ncbi:hypothetical protein HK101_000743 [Irineochytrium annulatum]|nr:hypothetical protein HK101_000743 [Irineochytrium annulatum]
MSLIGRAIVTTGAGKPRDVMKYVTDHKFAAPKPGWVLIKVKAFGLNRSELFTRQGLSPSVKFPRVLGIECVGQVLEAPGNESALPKDTIVAAIMGEMGRAFDGGYAEYACLPRRCIFPLSRTCFPAGKDIDWALLGAIPEMFQTAFGAVRDGLCVQDGQTLLVRGGTSSVGMAAAYLAKQMGATVVSTTRNEEKAKKLLELPYVDEVVIDDGKVADKVREKHPNGVDAVLELVGTESLLDSLKCARKQGTVCMVGILAGSWVLDKFSPMGDIPHTVRLTCYIGDTDDMDVHALEKFVKGVMHGELIIQRDKVFPLKDVPDAHQRMEDNLAMGKIVGVVE